jgi:hypothetical protein
MALVGPYTLVISNGVLQNSSDVFNILDPDSGGSATFTVPLSASGLAPITHYASHTMLEQATYDALATMTTTQFKAYVDQMQVQRGRTAVGSVTAFKNSLQMSVAGANPWTYLASLGLQRVATP